MNTTASLDWKVMNPAEALERRNAIFELRAWIQAREIAAHREDVKAFRARHLPNGRPLQKLRVDALIWYANLPGIQEMEARDDFQEHARWSNLEIDVPAAGGPGFETRAYPIPARPRSDSQRLGHLFPGLIKPPPPAPPQEEHPLSQLGGLAVELAETYGWTRSSAAAWVIFEDWQPRPEGVAVWYERPTLGFDLAGVEDRSIEFLRLRVTAPVDTPPDLILRAIQRVQGEVAAKYRYPVPSSARPYEEATLDAVRFALERNDGRSWLEIVREWNTAHPEFSFAETVDGSTRFGILVRRCYAQVIGRPLEWKRRPGKTSKHD